MSRRRFLVLLVPLAFFAGWVLVACGDDDAAAPTTDRTTVVPTVVSTVPTTEPATTEPATTVTTTTEPATTEPATTQAPTSQAPTSQAPTTVPILPDQPAVWPRPDLVVTSPEAAAADFVSQVLGVPPELGEFMAGDSRSGEIEVFSPGGGGPGSRVARSLLLMRQLGPDGGWFVIAAVDEHATITAPAAGATVAAGPLEVSGVARGFEATIIVKAFAAGDDTPLIDPVIAMGGAFETAEPYSATIDLSSVPSGTTVTILVRGDTGLETDPGEFSAIAVVVA